MLPAGAVITAKQQQQFQVSFCFDAGDKNFVKVGGHWSCNYGNISSSGLWTNTTPPHLGEVIVTWNDDAYHYSASSSLHVVSSTGGQACEIVPRSVVMCAGGTLQMAVRYSDAGTWSVSGPWGSATGAGAASITTGGLLTAPATLTTTTGTGTATVTGTSPWSGAFQVTYTDTDSHKTDIIMVVVNASACAPGASTPPAPPTSDTPCAAPAYPTLTFSPASQFYHWPGELLAYGAQVFLWCVVPPQACIDQDTQDIQTYQTKGLGSVMPELQTAITAAQTCTGPATDTLNFYTLADFANGCVYSPPGTQSQVRRRSALSRLPSVQSRFDSYSTPSGTTILRQANTSTGAGGPDSFTLDANFGASTPGKIFPDSLDLSAWHTVLIIVRTCMLVVAWVDFTRRLFAMFIGKLVGWDVRHKPDYVVGE